MLGKIWRFFHNPKLYIHVISYHVINSRLVLELYRMVLLPILVWGIRRKRVVNVIFLAMNPDMWRYDGVYRALKADPRFNPVIVTAMRCEASESVVGLEQDALVRYFAKRGHNVIKGYNCETHTWINLNDLRPDIIFHTHPYDGVLKNSKFEFRSNLLALHCYAPYSFQLSKVVWNWCNPLQDYAWRLFYVADYHLKIAREMSRIRGRNAVASGYCFDEELAFCARNYDAVNGVWRGDSRKRVIWAPHHSIKTNEIFKVSSFLEIAEGMEKLRDEYQDRIVFAFKPHPVLEGKLCEIWGVEKTKAYYARWANSLNSFDAQGDYHELFAGSDAMIHCSGSFILEYLFTYKPTMYYFAKSRNPPDLGEIGDAALGAHYPAHSIEDVRKFIDNVVLGGIDDRKNLRRGVVDRYLKAPNGSSFSENVYNEIVKGLGWDNVRFS